MYPDSSLKLNYETEDAIYYYEEAYDPLSNWSAHQVKVWGQVFPTLEHAYHYQKFKDTAPEVAKRIKNTPSPWAAMRIDRNSKKYLRSDWDEVKVAIMRELIHAKAAQNEDVRECLRRTGTKQIIENSPWDSFWGCGADGKGKNMTGKILMEVRDELLQSEGVAE